MLINTDTSLNNIGYMKYMQEQNNRNEDGRNQKASSRISRPPKQENQE